MDELRVVDALGKDWVVAILLTALGVVAWVNMVSPKLWTVVRRSFAAMRLGKQSLRDELSLRDRTLTGLLVMSVVVVSLFAYQTLVYNGWAMPGVSAFGRVLLVVAALTLARILLLRGLPLLASIDGGAEEYLYTGVLFTIVLGLALLPMSMLMSWPWQVEWRRWLWVVGTGCGVLLLLLLWLRAAVVGLGHGVPLRYIFIYLCAAEILPVALALEQAGRLISRSPHTL